MSRWLVLVCLIALPLCDAGAAELPSSASSETAAFPQATARLTLEDARRLAESANPTLRQAQAELAAAEGAVRDTRGWLWNNPQVNADVTRRRAPGPVNQTSTESAVGVSQAFEVAGQHGFRRKAAELDLLSTQEGIEETRRQIRAEVELRFARVLSFQRRIELERNMLKLVEDAARAVRRRVDEGEDSRLDGNLASVEGERARNQVVLLEEQLIQARADLAELLQLPAPSLPDVVGSLDPAALRYTLPELLSFASNRPLLRRLQFREGAAQNRLSLERAARYPDVTVGVTTGTEAQADGRERVTTLSVSIPLPVFRRNAGGVGRATTELTQAQIARAAATRDVEAQVRTLWLRLESLRARVGRLLQSVIPMLDENQRLSTIAYRAGEIGLLQLVVVNRQLLDARRDHLDALNDFIQTRIELEQLAGIAGGDALRSGL